MNYSWELCCSHLAAGHCCPDGLPPSSSSSSHSTCAADIPHLLWAACHIPFLLQVTQLQLTGDWSAGQVKEGLELALGGCQQLRAVMRQTLLEAALGAADEQDGVEGEGGMVE